MENLWHTKKLYTFMYFINSQYIKYCVINYVIQTEFYCIILTWDKDFTRITDKNDDFDLKLDINGIKLS